MPIGKSNPTRVLPPFALRKTSSRNSGIDPTGQGADTFHEPSLRTADACQRLRGSTLQSAWIRRLNIGRRSGCNEVLAVPRLRPACDPPLKAGFVFLGSRLHHKS